MPVYETFAKRKRQAENAGKPVIYSYDTLPKPFRVQVVQILTDVIGDPETIPAAEARIVDQRWAGIHDTMAREMGVFRLVRDLNPSQVGFKRTCSEFILTEEVDDVLSLIELAFGLLTNWAVGLLSELQNRHRSSASSNLHVTLYPN